MSEDPDSKPRNAYRFNSLTMLLLLVILPVLLAWASTRLSLQFDWTRDGRHTLSDTSLRLLEQIDGEVMVTAYAREQAGLREAIRDFIGKFQRNKPDIRLRFVNPDSVPDQVRNLGITINGELVLEYQGRTEHVREADEGAFINALMRLSRGTEKWLVFLEGHGERDPLGEASHDLGEWGNHLSNRGYRIQPLNLAEINAIPDNTSVIVLANPRVPMLPAEETVLGNYLQRGGNLLWLLEPDEGYIPEPVAEFLNLTVPGGTVIDVAGQLIGINDPAIAMITSSLYGQHPALSGFNFTTLFPKATTLQTSSDGIWDLTPLLTTGDHTWQERDLDSDEIEFNAETDLQGPLSIGLSFEREILPPPGANTETRQQRIIVIGDGDFLSNTHLAKSGNLDLGLRIINWLSGDDDLIQIPAQTAMDTQLIISPIVAGALGLFFLLGLPLILAITGLTVWWRRRRY
ncbi:MAG: GldG family protein [Gammaproteobacteria bacterium]